MKIVQSSWSCNEKNLLTFNAGWHAPEYNLMSWALSCLQLRRYYDNVTLHADRISANMLIDTLKLPYTELVCDLDILNNNPSHMWAFPKIHTYSQQTHPFLHVDGDIFIWKPFCNELLGSGLIAQNLEVATNYYESMMQSLEAKLDFLPVEILSERANCNPILAYNAGILGGNDLGFFDLYTQKAKEFVAKNRRVFSHIDLTAFNIIFEQYLFYCLAKRNDKKVNVLIQDIIPDNEYVGFGDFIEVPHNKHYLHLIGTFKRDKTVCEQMAGRLRYEYPEYYYRIIQLFKSKQVPLKRDYYYFVDQLTTKDLAKRYSLLKAKERKNALLTFGESRLVKPIELLRLKRHHFENSVSTSLKKGLQKKHVQGKVQRDIKLFLDNLDRIVAEKFSMYSNEFLYARDLAGVQYFQVVFEDETAIYRKQIVADKMVEIIEGKFDWSDIDLEEFNEAKFNKGIAVLPSRVFTCIIPECDPKGYSLVNIDDLDLMILQILKSPLTIEDLLNKAKTAFDADDLKESAAEFEMLIFGRIKMAFLNKLIKPFNY